MKTKTAPVEQAVKAPKGKKAGKVFGIILLILVLLVGITAAVNAALVKSEKENALSFAKVEIENQLVPDQDENGYWTFVTDEDFKVIQLTDIHIGGGWMSYKKDLMALNAVAAMITAEKPDLVVVTGDISYPVPFQAGTFNNLTSAKVFATLMEQLGVYWTVCFGNHDTEAYSYFSRSQISEFYGNDDFTYCLFEAGPDEVDGYGNQVINVKNSEGLITQSFYVFDSHSYVDGDIFGIMWKYDNIHANQVEWYKNTVLKLNAQNNALLKELGREENSDIKSLAFLHIPLVEQKDAWYEYAENGFEDTENVKYFYGVAGEGKKVVYPGIKEDELFETMLELGSTKGTFCGHDHLNNFSIEYKGIRLTYGMSVDYLAYPGIKNEGTQRGCTVITVSPDGSFDCYPENYYQGKYVSQYEKEEVTMQVLENLPYDEIVKE